MPLWSGSVALCYAEEHWHSLCSCRLASKERAPIWCEPLPLTQTTSRLADTMIPAMFENAHNCAGPLTGVGFLVTFVRTKLTEQ